LVYDKFTPEWLPKKDMEKMEKLYEERFRQISERFSGRLYEVEVVNELLCEVWWTTQTVISEKRDIVEWAFDLARKYFPNEVLVFNEGNPINVAARYDYRSPYFMMLENALLKGVEIDKIGLQHHEFRGATAKSEEEYEKEVKKGSKLFDPYELYKGLDVFASLGLPLELTEVTVPTFGETKEDEELQADLLEVLYTVCFGHEAVEGVVYWNVPDGYAYAPEGVNWNENACKGGLWHHDLTPKKSAERLYDLFNKKWHTDLELTTDENGYVEFRGFYGDYVAEIDGSVADFGIHKFEDNCTEVEI
jgi:GH35 family endo-1,4-beta-xylanase